MRGLGLHCQMRGLGLGLKRSVRSELRPGVVGELNFCILVPVCLEVGHFGWLN
jgi:hypothetical protein